MWVLCLHACMCTACMLSVHGGQKSTSGWLWNHSWMMSIKPEASGRAISALNCEAALLLQLFLFASVSIISGYFLSIWWRRALKQDSTVPYCLYLLLCHTLVLGSATTPFSVSVSNSLSLFRFPYFSPFLFLFSFSSFLFPILIPLTVTSPKAQRLTPSLWSTINQNAICSSYSSFASNVSTPTYVLLLYFPYHLYSSLVSQ